MSRDVSKLKAKNKSKSKTTPKATLETKVEVKPTSNSKSKSKSKSTTKDEASTSSSSELFERYMQFIRLIIHVHESDFDESKDEDVVLKAGLGRLLTDDKADNDDDVLNTWHIRAIEDNETMLTPKDAIHKQMLILLWIKHFEIDEIQSLPSEVDLKKHLSMYYTMLNIRIPLISPSTSTSSSSTSVARRSRVIDTMKELYYLILLLDVILVKSIYKELIVSSMVKNYMMIANDYINENDIDDYKSCRDIRGLVLTECEKYKLSSSLQVIQIILAFLPSFFSHSVTFFQKLKDCTTNAGWFGFHFPFRTLRIISCWTRLRIVDEGKSVEWKKL
jgi:hypothetical protein